MIKVTTVLVPGESSLLACRWLSSHCNLTFWGQRERGIESEHYDYDVTSYKDTDPIRAGPHLFKFI